jgi:hypothetical protein
VYVGLADAEGDGEGARKYEEDAAAPMRVGHQGDAGGAGKYVSRGLDGEDAPKHVSRSSPPASPPCSLPSAAPLVETAASVSELHAAADLMLHPLAASTSHVLDVIRPPSCSLEQELEKELVIDPTKESTAPADEADEEEEEEQRHLLTPKQAEEEATAATEPPNRQHAGESSGSGAVLKDGIVEDAEEHAR